MSNRLPVEVNPFRLIEQRRLLTGVVSLEQLPRLREVIAAPAEDFKVEMEFTRSPSGLPMIAGSVRGEVSVACQRCLEPVRVAVDAELNVVVTRSQTDRQPEEEGYEIYIVNDDRLFIQDFIEDEILLALPVVPRHRDCEPVRPLREASIDDVLEEDDGQIEKKNPFAALKDWKKTE